MTDTRDILFITWQDAQSRRILPIARLCKLGNGYEFAYINAVREAQELASCAMSSASLTDPNIR